MSNTVAFDNTFMYSSVEVGNAASQRPSEVKLIDDDDKVLLVRVTAPGLAIYLDVATATSLASQILSVIGSGCDPLWASEPTTGEEQDRWVEDIRAGAIGGDA